MADYYVNPALASNTGTGTVGDPFGDLQHALNSVMRSATGDTFTVTEGATEILAANLSYAIYGAPTATGWLSVIGAGSGATINCNGFGTVFPSFTIARNLSLTAYAQQGISPQGTTFSAHDCSFAGTLGEACRPSSGMFSGCYFGPQTSVWLRPQTANHSVHVVGCLFDGTIFVSLGGNTITGSIFRRSTGTAISNVGGDLIMDNLFIGPALSLGTHGARITGNLFVGTSAAAITTSTFRPEIVSDNAIYGHIAELSDPAMPIEHDPGVVLGANPLVDQQGGDYSLTAAGQSALAYLRTWPNLATTPGSTDVIGAWHPSGGGSSRRVLASPYLIGSLT